jgi:hypothetical protein
MSITNTMCRLSDLTQEQIDRLIDAMPLSVYLERGWYPERVLGFDKKGNSGFWNELLDSTIVTYKEMMQLLGKTMEFTKSNLKTGMFVRYRNGDYRVVIGDCLSGDGCAALPQYSEDLKYKGITIMALDIMAVYKAAKGTNISEYLSGHCLTLIWERTEQTEAQKEMELLQAQAKALQEQAQAIQEQITKLQGTI